MTRFGYDPTHSGLVSALGESVSIGLPLVGLLIDKSGGELRYCAGASVLTIVAHMLLLCTMTRPEIPIVILATSAGIVPTVVFALVGKNLSDSLGTAFAVMELTHGLGLVLGNIVVGYLHDHLGGYPAVISFLLALACLDLLLSLGLMRG